MLQDAGKYRRSRSTSSTAIEEDDTTPNPTLSDKDLILGSQQTLTERTLDHNAGKDLFHTLNPDVDLFPTPDTDYSSSTRWRSPSLRAPSPFQWRTAVNNNNNNNDNNKPNNPNNSDTDSLKSPASTLQEKEGTAPAGNIWIDRDEEEARPTPPVAVGFWDKDLAHTRKKVFLKYSSTLLILCVAVMAILSIYWGVLFDVKEYLPHAHVAVVSFEGLPPYEAYTPLVGPFIRSACEAEIASRSDHLGFQFRDPAEFGYDPINVRRAVFNEEIWAAIIINSNATALLTEAVLTGNTTYDPRGSATIVYNQARDIESYNFYVVPVLDRIALQVTTTFGASWIQRVVSNSSYDVATYSRSPQALSPGISFTSLNLRPFDPPTAIPTITIGLIYLIIIAFFSFTFFIPTHMKFILPNPASPHPPLKFYQLIIYRWCATIVAYFFLSLAYSLVSLAFQIPFSNAPPPVPSPLNDGNGHWTPTEPIINANYLGQATFFVYFLLNFVGMAALGLTCENMAMFLSALSPLPFSALFLIFWVITNVSTGFYAIELASDFYAWGYAWPLRHIVEGSKTLVFGTKSRLGTNFGVLLAWVIVSTFLFPIACWVMRWKSMKDRKRAAEAAKKLEVNNG